ncbi:hypothetical protein Mapa_013436 [Marchantia paleacea]|nr:hypothetical protein Mapa_013436 [Marchantia paleacea]
MQQQLGQSVFLSFSLMSLTDPLPVCSSGRFTHHCFEMDINLFSFSAYPIEFKHMSKANSVLHRNPRTRFQVHSHGYEISDFS